LVVTEETAEKWGGRDVTAAVHNCDTLRIGHVADEAGPAQLGVCELGGSRGFRDSATMFAAILAGEIDAGWTTTAATGIPPELLTLSDKTSLIRAENVVPLYR
ncbi:hypothetical protein ABQF26_38365, partial [Mycolicibacterium elephantis]